MRSGNTFYPKFNNVLSSYREMQQVNIKIEKTLGVTFRKYANLEFLNSLANCLLIIGDSREEIYKDKEFVKLATAGRCHKNIKVIYMKLILLKLILLMNTHHFVQISSRHSTGRIFRQTVEPC